MTYRRLKLFGAVLAALSLAGCGAAVVGGSSHASADSEMRPLLRPATVPATDARTAEEFDTTTAEDREAALADADTAGVVLGVTIASLGNPAEPGFWLKTPLVSETQPGLLRLSDGTTAEVTLIPLPGVPGAGSRISLAAMRLIGVPLADLAELTVLAR